MRKFLLKEAGNLISPQTRTTNYTVTSKAGVSKEYTDVSIVQAVRLEQCALTRGKGKFTNKNTPRGLLRWRAPSNFVRVNSALYTTYGSCTFDNTTSAGVRCSGTAKGYGDMDVNDIYTAMSGGYTNMTTGFYTLDQVAATRCLLKIKDQKIDLSTAAAELKSTVSMLAQLSMSVYRAYKAARKGDLKAIYQEFKPGTVRRPPRKGWSTRDAASRWLEVQYGIMPLISDINGLSEWLNTSPAAQLTFRTTGSAIENFHETLFERTGARPGFVNISGKRVVKTIVHWQMEDYRLHRATQAGINPLVTAWELVPYSFVVDWFLPIGNWLSTFDATVGTAFVSGTRTRFIEADFSGNASVVARTPTGFVPLKYTSSLESYLWGGFTGTRRDVLGTYPFAFPYIKNPLSTTHVANAIALARNLRPR